MTSYKCNAGDRIDSIVYKHYGNFTHLNDVIAVNKQLFNKPLSLESGMIINLPDFSVNVQHKESVTDQCKKRKPLW
jgi:phage tail protein X